MNVKKPELHLKLFPFNIDLKFLILFFVLSNSAFGQSYDGYTLYFPQGGTKAYLVDINGNNYHTWTFSTNSKTCYSTYLLAEGILLRTVSKQGNYFNGGPISGEVQKTDWDGNVLWDFVYSTQEFCSHHDIHAMPNGNILLIAYERKTASQATQAGCSQSIEMWPDKIVEIQPSGTNEGTVVWEWHAWDHLVQEFDPSKNNYGVVADHPELMNINYHTSKDWMHMNGIDYNVTLDQIVFSSHALNEIYVIDHSTTTTQAASHCGGNSGKGGDILYRWGNPPAYQAPGTADFNVVHDAHWVAADNPLFPNYLAGYNNKGGAGGKTCVDIINPPYNGYNYLYTPGTAYAPSTYDWRHTYTGNMSQDNGNSQQLPNGNTLICIGMSGYIYEIDSNQNVIWSKTVGGVTAQSFRYPPCYITGDYNATAGSSSASVCQGETSQLDVTVSGGDVYTYSWTSDPAGFTSNIKNPLVTPSVNTTYVVMVTNGPCTATDSVFITVNLVPPKPFITQSGDSLVSSAATGNQWFLDGVAIAEANSQVFVPEQAGSYQVQITDQNQCISELSAPYLFASVPVSESTNSILIYPNPTNGKVYIRGTEMQHHQNEINIFNSLGQMVLMQEEATSLDLSCFPSGIYYLIIKSKNLGFFHEKIFITH